MEEREQIGWLLAAIFILAIGTAGLVAASYLKDEYIGGRAVQRSLKAMVKGSIYETGEMMSVFGTCMDAYDIPVSGSEAYLTAYYPNGSLWFSNETMANISTGYFVWQGPMDVIGGTYLTEMTCIGLNQTAKAFGEWQNPVWVARVGSILDLANYSYLLILDIEGQIIGINATVEEIKAIVESLNTSIIAINQTIIEGFNNTWHNITFLQENMTNNFNYTNQLILDTQIIANASVDRNDSLLATLMMMLINHTGTPVSGNLTWVEDYDAPKYWKYWDIRVDVYNEYGTQVSSPDVACTINTTITPLEYMDVNGNHFTSRIFISELWYFGWDVNCFYT